MASPTAVEVKLLLSEYREWGESASYGDHQPSATTWPWRTSMKLFIDSMFLSAASTNARMAEDEMPCASGLPRATVPRRCTGSPDKRPMRREKSFHARDLGMIGRTLGSDTFGSSPMPRRQATRRRTGNQPIRTTNSPGRTC